MTILGARQLVHEESVHAKLAEVSSTWCLAWAIGVSGATGSQDDVISKVGVAAIK
jgi:hypothetical protein